MKREKTKKLEALFDDGNTIPFTIRVPKGLLEKLQADAEKLGIPLATYARDLLSVHYIPDVLESLIQEGSMITPDVEDSYTAFRDHVRFLDSKIIEVLKYQRITKGLKERLDVLDRLIERKVDRIFAHKTRKKVKNK